MISNSRFKPSIKAILLGALLTFPVLSTDSFADDGPADFKGYAETLKSRLNLTPEQAYAVEDIVNGVKEQQQLILEKNGIPVNNRPELTRREKWEIAKEMKAVRNDASQKIIALLTDEQQEVFDEVQKERREQFKNYLLEQRQSQ